MKKLIEIFNVVPNITDKIRSAYGRDRDRILYSKDFLRLGGKTQIFVEGYDDHMRNRLTHTLEVAQISNTISTNFNLNIDLTSAIAYGHDIGHTPFGHAGERVLNKIMNGCYKINQSEVKIFKNNRGFKHNWHGLRVLNELNKRYTGEVGFEVNKYTEWGILHHTKLHYNLCKRIVKDKNILKCGNYTDSSTICKSKGGFCLGFYQTKYKEIEKIDYLTLEALIVEKADEIAQRHHDIEDGLIGKLITIENITKLFPANGDNIYEKLNDDEKKIIDDFVSGDMKKMDPILKKLSHLLINVYVRDLITSSTRKMQDYVDKYKLTKKNQFHEHKIANNNIEEIQGLIDFSDDLKKIDKKLKEYLKSSILNSLIAQSMDSKAEYVILKLVNAYIRNPQYLPKKTINDVFSRINKTYPKFISDEEANNPREFISDKHFTKLQNPHYINYFLRGICDFIAGMTDDFAYKQYNLIYGTNKMNFDKYNE